MIESQKLTILRNINFQALTKQCEALEEYHWVQHVNKRGYDGNWSVVALRGLACHLNSHPILQAYQIEADNEANWADFPVLGQLPEVKLLLSELNLKFMAVRLMKLDGGAWIKPHSDFGLSIEHGQARLHIPLLTSKDVEFVSDGRALPMNSGELWYINAHQQHSVKNHGSISRINLVMDIVVNDKFKNNFLAHRSGRGECDA